MMGQNVQDLTRDFLGPYGTCMSVDADADVLAAALSSAGYVDPRLAVVANGG